MWSSPESPAEAEVSPSPKEAEDAKPATPEVSGSAEEVDGEALEEDCELEEDDFNDDRSDEGTWDDPDEVHSSIPCCAVASLLSSTWKSMRC
ncbi:hypothetical protein L596_004663 [Steinernema carpocapsae]|uniref:Uncharacterized protein n=1 Tax=Steinernema carpocapsae TaxID=34508 RepID=A0A4U8UY04_STECR|nr:hypothetical protein L596_004663 [Steinernema carpocapsae]